MTTATKNIGVANTIVEQLGGNKFRTMTGAKNILAIEAGVSFRMPAGFAINKINYVKITLNAADLYDMEFGRIWGGKYTVVSTYNSVMGDQLRGLFKDVTGLDTHL